MSPPPLTPAPRRFLLPSAKRSEQTPSSSYAPGQQSQFHSTPKFAPPSTPWSTRQAPQGIEEVEDVVDEDNDQGEGSSSSFGENGKDKAGDGTGAKLVDDDIEAGNETSGSEGSQRDTKRGHQWASFMDEDKSGEDEGISRDDGIDGSDTHQVLHLTNERLYKRQRVSLSPDIQSESLLSDHGDNHVQIGRHVPEYVTHVFAKPSDNDPLPAPVSAEDGHDSHHSDEHYDSSPGRAQASRAPNQPTFLTAPRFRAPSPSSVPAEILPTAFSPQRRGQQFLAGGMAATLQTQLSEIKSWEGQTGSTPQPTTTNTNDGERAGGEWIYHVVEVRAGKRMYLIRGLAAAGQDNRRVILAGEGTLTGLGRRAQLSVGDKVKVRQPVWEAVIERETWLVACDWNVSL